MKQEGNQYEQFIRDEKRFDGDAGYREGWVAGQEEGKRLQVEAASIGNAIGNAYSGAQGNNEVKRNRDFDSIARDAVNDVDTSGMDQLGK